MLPQSRIWSPSPVASSLPLIVICDVAGGLTGNGTTASGGATGAVANGQDPASHGKPAISWPVVTLMTSALGPPSMLIVGASTVPPTVITLPTPGSSSSGSLSSLP